MIEGVPKPLETNEEVEIGYDREAVRAEAELQLEKRLQNVEIDEDMPEKFHHVARLESLLKELDVADFNNQDRHLSRVAEEAWSHEMSNMNQVESGLYHEYRVFKSLGFTDFVAA